MYYVVIILFNIDKSNSTLFILTCILIFLLVIYLGLTLADSYYQYTGKSLHKAAKIFYIMIRGLYYLITIYSSIIIFIGNSIITGLIYCFSIYLTDIVYSTMIILIVVFIPILIIGLIIEGVVRIIICKLSCSNMKPRMNSYTYALYNFNQDNAKESTACSICLNKYTEENTDLVILLCMSKHIFHEKCIIEWIKKDIYCPICRKQIVFSVD